MFCKNCQTEKCQSEFSKNKTRPKGYEYRCKSCQTKRGIDFYKKNKDKILKRIKTEYYPKNRRILINKQEKYRKTFKGIQTLRKASKKYYLKNRKEIIKKNSDYKKKRKSIDLNFYLTTLLRSRLNAALKNNQKAGSAVRDLGCSISELKAYLEVRFKPGMSWENHGKWHIDHIKPLSSFDLTNREEFRKACHYSNLQPLWSSENMKKGSK